jgi:hypothetical protein
MPCVVIIYYSSPAPRCARGRMNFRAPRAARAQGNPAEG